LAFGELQRSDASLLSADALRERMAGEGYLYLTGLLDREEVLSARRFITEKLSIGGHLDPNHPDFEAVAAPDSKLKFKPDFAEGNHALMKVLYSGAMPEFFTRFLGDKILHFDFTWLRTIAPGRGTASHCDIVYMGRGTKAVYTAWVPLGDISYDIGGLMILEKSHLQAERLRRYLESDVDTYCSNLPADDPKALRGNGWAKGGALTQNPVSLQKQLGGRWLSCEFRAGDALIFSMQTVHASLDNHSPYFRISSDSRYQLASEPADERWLGANPIGHNDAGKRGKIC
jgi:hypothetical protein